jgi:hypothetical protein
MLQLSSPPQFHGDIGPPIALLSAAIIGMVQAVPAGDFSQFSQFGLLGLVLGWLMWRVERKLDEIKNAYDDSKDASNRMSKAIVLLVLAVQGDDGAKHQADALLRELDTKK